MKTNNVIVALVALLGINCVSAQDLKLSQGGFNSQVQQMSRFNHAANLVS